MDQNPTKESRPPINLRIKFRSENVEQFIERYAVDVSRGGIFIRTREPLAVGTQLKLDFQFQNGNALMAGDGTVVWIREFDPNRTTVPPGMGVRFDKLSPESQAVLEQLLIEKAKRERGGVPGSGAQSGGGGIAVRRPSSMFSVLEPQVSVAEGADGDKTANLTAAVAAAATARTPGSQSLAEKLGAKPIGAKTEAAPGYRPLGTAKNPFSSTGTPGPTTTAGASASPASSPPASGSSSPPGARPLSDLLPLFAGGARASASAMPPAARNEPVASSASSSDSDFDEEPTQIAGRLPSFLTSDSDATTEVPADLAESVRTAPPLPVDFLPGSSPDSERPGASRPKQSLDDMPPDSAAPEATAAPEPSPAEVVDGPKETPKPVAASAATPNAAPKADTAEKAPVAAAATAPPATAVPAAKKRSAAPVVVAVLVLGASATFLYKFFGSHATENVVAAPTTTGSPAVVTGEPAAPPPAIPPPPEPAVPAAEPAAAAAPPVPAPMAPATPPPPTEPAKTAADTKPAAPAVDTVEGSPKKSSAKKKAKASPAAATIEPPPTDTSPTGAPAAPAEASEAAAVAHQIKVTSKPAGADVSLDGQSVGKTPFSIGIADISAPHAIAVRKDGFEPFEQMIGPSSAWSKAKASKGKPALSILKLNAKLKPIGGAAPEGDGKPATEPPAAGEGAPKSEAKPDRPLPPSDQPAGEGP